MGDLAQKLEIPWKAAANPNPKKHFCKGISLAHSSHSDYFIFGLSSTEATAGSTSYIC